MGQDLGNLQPETLHEKYRANSFACLKNTETGIAYVSFWTRLVYGPGKGHARYLELKYHKEGGILR